MSDAFNRANSGGLVALVNSLGWKGTGILILVIIIDFIIASFSSIKESLSGIRIKHPCSIKEQKC
ncbi:DUF6366 family protein [Anaerobacillus alkalidiazotrophicus]|uniref:DUF6366 family protein n=1 Tax=Anaerobacillus alkalidiazotrophicus TaxID=472963 RepID=UPI0038996E2A